MVRKKKNPFPFPLCVYVCLFFKKEEEKENQLNGKGVTNFTKSQHNESPLLNIYIKKY